MTRKSLTEKQEQKILELYDSGMASETILERFSISQSVLSKVLINNNRQTRKKKWYSVDTKRNNNIARTIYIMIKNKKELNERIEKEMGLIIGREYLPTHVNYEVKLNTMPLGTIVKIYSCIICNNPQVTKIGVISKKRNGRIYVK